MFDPNMVAFGYGAVGAFAGYTARLWLRKSELEERCDFLSDLENGLAKAMEQSNSLLKSGRLPATTRRALLHLLFAYTDKEIGESFVNGLLESGQSEPSDEGYNPLMDEMSSLAKDDPELHRHVHEAFMTLMFALLFMHKADHIKVEKVQMNAARDPSSMLGRLGKLLGVNNDSNHHDAGPRTIYA